MNRRTILSALFCAAALAAQTKRPIELHVDLTVAPAKEQELLKNFRTVFEPAIRRQPEFTGVKLLKLREVKAGKAPAGANYRLLIGFATEEARVKWVESKEHNVAWPSLEGTLGAKDYNAILYDVR